MDARMERMESRMERMDSSAQRMEQGLLAVTDRLDRLITVSIQVRTFGVERLAELERRIAKLEDHAGFSPPRLRSRVDVKLSLTGRRQSAAIIGGMDAANRTRVPGLENPTA